VSDGDGDDEAAGEADGDGDDEAAGEADGDGDDEAAGEADGDGDDEAVTVVVVDGDDEHELSVARGRVLRDVLLEAGLSPYATVTERANCGGRGLCATCGVRLENDVEPTHWHDALADRFGYPRLSCQIRVAEDLVVELDDEKRIWGGRE